MKRWAVLSLITVFALIWAGCGGGAFEIGFGPGEQDAAPDQASDANQPDAKPDGHPETGKDAKSEADAVADAPHDTSPEADAGQDVTAEAEASIEPQPEAGEDAVDAPEAAVEAGQDATEEPEAAVDAPVDSPPDVAPDGPPLTPCQKWGEAGEISVIVETATDPVAGKVLGIFGEYTSYGDAGISTGLATWKVNPQNPQPPDAANRIVYRVGPTESMSLQFEPGYASPGDTNFNHWLMACTAVGCPLGDHYQVCDGLDPLGGWWSGQLHGGCDTVLSGNMSFRYIHCWK